MASFFILQKPVSKQTGLKYSRRMDSHFKHEIIRCERCNAPFECKANKFTQCQCAAVPLTLNETQYISEMYDGCLCASCLRVLQQEYIATIS